MSSATQLVSATEGFNHLFSNEIVEARTTFASDDSPFHLLGLGVCAFLEAALGMEVHSTIANNVNILLTLLIPEWIDGRSYPMSCTVRGRG